MGLIYLDANIVISAVQDVGRRGDHVRRSLERTTETPATSDLIRMECRVKPIREGDFGLAAEFDHVLDEFEQLPLRSDVYRVATEIRSRYAVKTPDALHLATAQVHGCSAFWTNDLRLSSVLGAMRLELFEG